MPRIHVCSLALIDETVEETGARSLVTLLNPGTRGRAAEGRSRPSATSIIAVADIVEDAPGQVAAGATRTCANCSTSSAAGTAPRRC